MLFSDVFSRSPQLGAFLRFVTEAVLHGKGDRIKAYTIGVEVLRRDPTFDPQIDPIVRVEATRLRRAMERYYAGPGQDNSIVIDLPRGSYVPTFRRREFANARRLIGRHGRAVAGTVASDAHACAAGGGHDRRHRRGRVAAFMSVIRAARLRLRPSLLCATAKRGAVQRCPPATACRSCGSSRFASSVRRRPHSVAAERLRAKIGDAFARFDTINVASDPALASADYADAHAA